MIVGLPALEAVLAVVKIATHLTVVARAVDGMHLTPTATGGRSGMGWEEGERSEEGERE